MAWDRWDGWHACMHECVRARSSRTTGSLTEGRPRAAGAAAGQRCSSTGRGLSCATTAAAASPSQAAPPRMLLLLAPAPAQALPAHAGRGAQLGAWQPGWEGRTARIMPTRRRRRRGRHAMQRRRGRGGRMTREGGETVTMMMKTTAAMTRAQADGCGAALVPAAAVGGRVVASRRRCRRRRCRPPRPRTVGYVSYRVCVLVSLHTLCVCVVRRRVPLCVWKDLSSPNPTRDPSFPPMHSFPHRTTARTHTRTHTHTYNQPTRLPWLNRRRRRRRCDCYYRWWRWGSKSSRRERWRQRQRQSQAAGHGAAAAIDCGGSGCLGGCGRAV